MVRAFLDIVLFFRRESREQRTDERAQRHDRREDVDLALRLTQVARQEFNEVYQARVEVTKALWEQAPSDSKELRRQEYEAALDEYKAQLDRQVGVVVIARNGPLTALEAEATVGDNA